MTEIIFIVVKPKKLKSKHKMTHNQRSFGVTH